MRAMSMSEPDIKSSLVDYWQRAVLYQAKSGDTDWESMCIGVIFLDDLGMKVPLLPLLGGDSAMASGVCVQLNTADKRVVEIPSFWYRALISTYGVRRAKVMLAQQYGQVYEQLVDHSFCVSQARTYKPKAERLNRVLAARVIFMLMNDATRKTKICA